MEVDERFEWEGRSIAWGKARPLDRGQGGVGP
ncbi:hypothetical protein EV650_1449 [Kribbella kalugense]|uniref:Uncharacterized protein n=1 Tax=Kribbella kalugense TaxID=2512221 RepID=A0A4R7ZX91_9ACTN|nr:hypothetical protein EV650_1449 [Kribbella kalugense]